MVGLSGWRRAALVVASTALALIGTAPAWAAVGTASPPSGEPISFGYIDIYGGPFAHPETEATLQAYFRDWNARGGLDGRPVRLVYDAAGFDPGKNIADMQEMATRENVVAFLSPGICSYTKPLLTSLRIPLLGGADDNCYDPSVMFPTGGQGPTVPMLKWAIDNGAKHFGALYPSAPGIEASLIDPLRAYLANNPGVGLTTKALPLVTTAADIDAGISEMKAAGVDALFYSAQPTDADLWLQSGERQGFGPSSGIKWISPSGLYTEAVADLPSIEGTHVMSQYTPWEDTGNPEVKRALKGTRGTGPRTNFTADAWHAAATLERSLRGFKGPITRESLTERWGSIHRLRGPLLPFKVDLSDLSSHPSGGQILEARNGHWVPAGDYLVIPADEFG